MRLLSHNNSADNGYGLLNRRHDQSPRHLAVSTDSPAPETSQPHLATGGPDFDTILSKIGSCEQKEPLAKNVRYPEFSLSTKQRAEARQRS